MLVNELSCGVNMWMKKMIEWIMCTCCISLPHTVVQKHAIVPWSLHSHWWYHWKPFSHTHTHTHTLLPCASHKTTHNHLISQYSLQSVHPLFTSCCPLSNSYIFYLHHVILSHITAWMCSRCALCGFGAPPPRHTTHWGRQRCDEDSTRSLWWACVSEQWMIWCINALVRARMIRWVEG